MKIKQIFQIISYLQYPLLLLAMVFVFKPYFSGLDHMKENFDAVVADFNNVLIFAGLGISMSTLQDTNRTQNNISKKIWEDPQKGTWAIIILSIMTLSVLLGGIFSFYISTNEILKQLSIGIIVMGIGLIGFLKASLEIFENHRRDRNF